MRRKTKANVPRLLALGMEAAPELADEVLVSIAQVEAWLEELLRDGIVEREAQPTYQGKFRARVYYRYRVKKALPDGVSQPMQTAAVAAKYREVYAITQVGAGAAERIGKEILALKGTPDV